MAQKAARSSIGVAFWDSGPGRAVRAVGEGSGVAVVMLGILATALWMSFLAYGLFALVRYLLG